MTGAVTADLSVFVNIRIGTDRFGTDDHEKQFAGGIVPDQIWTDVDFPLGTFIGILPNENQVFVLDHHGVHFIGERINDLVGSIGDRL